jgi:hypothetical protein
MQVTVAENGDLAAWKVVLRKELTAAWTPRRIAERCLTNGKRDALSARRAATGAVGLQDVLP